MSQSDIQYFMQSLSDLNEKFKQKHYKLTPLEQNATINLIEQLYTKLITTPTESPSIESKVIPQPKIINSFKSEKETSNQSQEINNEIEAVFSPKQEKPVIAFEKAKANRNFQLGINEKIMFAKELFDDDANALNESIRQLTSFESGELAMKFFEDKLSPFLYDEGKDEEIIEEYKNIINRIYS